LIVGQSTEVPGGDDLEAEPEHAEPDLCDEPALGALEQPLDQTHRSQNNRTDRELDDGESGIGEQDGLDE